MTFTEYFEYFFFMARSLFLLYFHAIISSFGAFNMEINLAIRFITLDYSSNRYSFVAAYNTPYIELGEIKAINFMNRGPGRNYWTRHPHRATMMDPHIQRISVRRVIRFKYSLISPKKMAVIFRNGMIFLFMFIKI